MDIGQVVNDWLQLEISNGVAEYPELSSLLAHLVIRTYLAEVVVTELLAIATSASTFIKVC